MCEENKSQYHSRAAPSSVLGPPGFDPIPLLADTFPVFSKEIREDGVKDSPGWMVVLADVAGNVWDSPFEKEKTATGKRENPMRLCSATKPLRCLPE